MNGSTIRAGAMAMAAAALFFLAACGAIKAEVKATEDDPDKTTAINGTGSSPAVNTAEATLTGQAFKGPLDRATVTIYALNNDRSLGEALASTQTDTTGHWTAEGTFEGPVAVIATGGSYIDEATGQQVDNNDSNDQLIALIESVSNTMNVACTPLTTIAAQRAIENKAQGMAEAIANAKKEVASLFNIKGIDIVSTPPVDLTAIATKNPAQQDAARYGLAMAALTQTARDNGIPPGKVMQMIRDFSEDYSDGQLDGKKQGMALAVDTLTPNQMLQAMEAAKTNFLEGEHNHSEWNEEALETSNDGANSETENEQNSGSNTNTSTATTTSSATVVTECTSENICNASLLSTGEHCEYTSWFRLGSTNGVMYHLQCSNFGCVTCQ